MRIFSLILQWGAIVGRIWAEAKIKNEYRAALPFRRHTARR